MPARFARATKPVVTRTGGTNAASGDAGAASDGFDADWEELRASEDIQFEPSVPEVAEPREPSWLEQWLEDAFGSLFDNLGPAFGAAWPVVKVLLIVAAVAAIALLVWRIVIVLPRRREQAEEDAPAWIPPRKEALALLEEADRLAEAGDYDGATHLLLQRSVGQIAAARPEWLGPASTAREIARLPALPQAARAAFAAISQRVERSLFALQRLDRADWDHARAAYADFARVSLTEVQA